MPVHGHWRWQPLVAIGTLYGLTNAQIVHRKDVKPAKGKNEKHFCSPAPNTFDTQQLVHHFGIAVRRKPSELQGTVLDLRGEIFQIDNFLAGQANAPQSVIRGTEQRLRGQGVRVIESQEAHHNGPGSFAAELLIDNGSAQHHQEFQAAWLQSTRSTARDNTAEDRVCLLEMGNSFSVV